MNGAKPVLTPLPTSQPLLLNSSSPLSDPIEYIKVVGGLQYLLITGLDLAFAINKLSQYMHTLTTYHWSFVKCLLHYLCGTLNEGLQIHRQSPLNLLSFSNHLHRDLPLNLQTYLDVDWVGDKDDFCLPVHMSSILVTIQSPGVLRTLSVGPLYHSCFNPEKFTKNSPFHANLNSLLNRLAIKVPPTYFKVSSTSKDQSQVYGLGLCCGDVSKENCKTCIVDASKELQKSCPTSKGAIIWYDYCLVKYSDVYFFGKIDNNNKFSLLNVNDVENSTSVNANVKKLLSNLSYKASATLKLYATGKLEIDSGEDGKLYGLAQCTRGLNDADCKKYLDVAISEIPNCCSGKRGGHVVGGNCSVGYELYPIV
ncbi:hypothetical protein UlMin_030269 [Ulmus minor]